MQRGIIEQTVLVEANGCIFDKLIKGGRKNSAITSLGFST